MTGAAVERRQPPPKGLMRVLNVLPRVLLRSPLHGLMSKTVLLLTFTGRKSGREYTIPMSYVQTGDEILMSTEAPWWKNLAVDGGVSVGLVLRGRRRAGVAGAVSDQRGAVDGLTTILRHYPEYRRFVGVETDEAGEPRPETVVRAVRRGRVTLRVRLEEAE